MSRAVHLPIPVPSSIRIMHLFVGGATSVMRVRAPSDLVAARPMLPRRRLIVTTALCVPSTYPFRALLSLFLFFAFLDAYDTCASCAISFDRLLTLHIACRFEHNKQAAKEEYEYKMLNIAQREASAMTDSGQDPPGTCVSSVHTHKLTSSDRGFPSSTGSRPRGFQEPNGNIRGSPGALSIFRIPYHVVY